jgi:hypothetical protein
MEMMESVHLHQPVELLHTLTPGQVDVPVLQKQVAVQELILV